MAKRVFELPKEQELTKDQRAAIRKPLEGQYLVFGAPGTGKSVVALWRFKKFAQEQQLFFLTYNKVLNQSNKTLIASESELTQRMFTATSWIYKQYSCEVKKWCEETGAEYQPTGIHKVPEIKTYQPDFDQLQQRLKEYGSNLSSMSLIIDEGQDLACGWYQTFIEAGVENFFIVADQNQQITDQNSNNDQLRDLLGIEKNDVILLRENWRNTTPIAALANYFYTDKASALPDLPSKPSANTPILYEYKNPASVTQILVDSFLKDKSKLLGFIVAKNEMREFWLQKIIYIFRERNEDVSAVRTYSSSGIDSSDIDFNNGGIVVINDMSVKGIEFDEVFILINGFSENKNNREILKKRMYVMTSRARERLFFLKVENQNCVLHDLLPKEDQFVTVNYNDREHQVQLLKRISI